VLVVLDVEPGAAAGVQFVLVPQAPLASTFQAASAASAGVTGKKTRERETSAERSFFVRKVSFGFTWERFEGFFKFNSTLVKKSELQRIAVTIIRCADTGMLGVHVTQRLMWDYTPPQRETKK
jgi:hypothetical protein